MGKIATFRQSVLMRLRRRREHAARHAFERAKAQADVIRQRIAHLRKAVDIENGFVRQAIFSGEQAAREPAPPDSGVLLRYRRNIEQLRQVILADTLRLAEAERLLDWRRRELIEAIQQRKGAFILAERLRAEETSRLAREEVSHADETHAACHASRAEETP